MEKGSGKRDVKEPQTRHQPTDQARLRQFEEWHPSRIRTGLRNRHIGKTVSVRVRPNLDKSRGSKAPTVERKLIFMSSANQTLVRRFFDETCNQGKLEVTDEIFSPDHKYHDPSKPFHS